jgi:hypothetical protein
MQMKQLLRQIKFPAFKLKRSAGWGIKECQLLLTFDAMSLFRFLLDSFNPLIEKSLLPAMEVDQYLPIHHAHLNRTPFAHCSFLPHTQNFNCPLSARNPMIFCLIAS